ncbi:MAG TPA: diguanylate cyclase [Actinomycetota bacterium]|nr:diguanylate cyclase [Actinomycetota bacterium]
MTLRARLTLFFIGIVVVPLIAATILLQVLIGREAARQAEARLDAAARTVANLWEARLREARAESRVAAASVAPRLGSAELSAILESLRADAELDLLVITDEAGEVVASAFSGPMFRASIPPPTPQDLASPEGFPGLLRAQIPVVAGDRRVTLTGGWYADARLIRELSAATGTDVAVVSGKRVLASTLAQPPEAPPVGEGSVRVQGDRLAITVAEQRVGVVLVGPAQLPGTFPGYVWVVVSAGLILAAVLGFVLARTLAEPLEQLVAGARSVAAGNLQTRVEAEGQDFARIAEAFNLMTTNLQRYVGEVEQSRDELRRGLERLGVTLGSTHDLEAMLGVILDTAAVTLRARAGALYLLHPGARELRPEVAVGYEPPVGAALHLDEGVAGTVAASGRPVLVSGPDGKLAPRPPVEPSAPTALGVPLLRGDRSMGVLALYGRTLPDPFAEDDLDTLGSFAAQASVAIENVLLHREAQRLSITDGLTGVWNRRYLALTLAKEIERAQRFGRPLSVLMVDIDRFKDVNDAHGHLRGDEVLVELSRRMLSRIRGEIDTLARFGGEEFVIVLPETPREGARVVANKLRRAVRAKAFVSDVGPDVAVTVSIGVAAYPEDGTTAEGLIQAADVAMYKAKRRGRDRVESPK